MDVLLHSDLVSHNLSSIPQVSRLLVSKISSLMRKKSSLTRKKSSLRPLDSSFFVLRPFKISCWHTERKVFSPFLLQSLRRSFVMTWVELNEQTSLFLPRYNRTDGKPTHMWETLFFLQPKIIMVILGDITIPVFSSDPLPSANQQTLPFLGNIFHLSQICGILFHAIPAVKVNCSMLLSSYPFDLKSTKSVYPVFFQLLRNVNILR